MGNRAIKAAAGEAADTRKYKGILLSLLLVGISWYFWHSAFLYPVRMFVVLLHEIGHGVGAVATGGELIRIELVSAEGGAALTRGGSRFIILNSGYLGSLLFGCLILLSSKTLKASGVVLTLIALTTAVVTALFLRPILGFSFLYGIGASITLSALALKAPLEVQSLILRFLGIFSCLYALFDIRDDVLNFGRSSGVSDATMLQELTHIPAALWGIGWLALSIMLLFLLRRRLFG